MLSPQVLCVVAAHELDAKVYGKIGPSGETLYGAHIPNFFGNPYYVERKSWEELAASLSTLLDVMDLMEPCEVSSKLASGYLPTFSVN